MNKKVLVTGGLGFIGYHLTKQLVSEGWGVDIVDNFSHGEYSHDNYKELSELPNVLIADLDLTTDEIFDLDADDYEAVFHLAALPRVQYSFDNITKTTFNNCVSTANIVEFCRGKDVKLIFASSSTAIGKISPYGQQKAYGEQLISSCLKKYTIARLFSVYGPRMNVSGDYTLLIPELISCARRGKKFNLYGDGSVKRDFTYVDDIVEALIDLIDDKNCHMKPLSLGNNNPRTVMEAIRIVEEITGRKIDINLQPARKEEKVTKAKAMRLLSHTTLEEGIKKTIEAIPYDK